MPRYGGATSYRMSRGMGEAGWDRYKETPAFRKKFNVPNLSGRSGYQKGFSSLRARPRNKAPAMNKSLNVFKYPFSTATLAAKIPDGRATLSSGQRFQSADAVQCGTGDNFLLLMPSYCQCLWYYTPGLGGNTTIGGSALFSTKQKTEAAEIGLASGGGGTVGGVTVAPTAAANTATDWKATRFASALSDVEMLNEVAKWRLVSAGAKITLINNSDSNEGYFEAVRVSFHGVTGLVDPAMVKNTLSHLIDGQLLDQPSYVSGKLRDIHKYAFSLKPDGINHDFELPTVTLDGGFDAILIKIVGRAVAAGSGGTQVLVHTASNQEVVYTPQSRFVRFQTESQFMRNWNAQSHAQSIDIKAATKKMVS